MDELSLTTAREEYGQDANSVHLPLRFTAPQEGDYSAANCQEALEKVGFKSFSMDGFGVTSGRLKAIAQKPRFPVPIAVSP